ncbi:recombinase family protein (plasmid) [Entomospira entomophila]|uniref:Recombinase family protein n=1 Tax=Entomospira entomophila TaxID=2719988 RepID=A0A968KX74_9SPIO|nr:recombinase family protein [Entomospira entomophilus]NIZ41565.1 recombinase family protein [Entomospira entomophilus]WDI36469.1 recombinase family protein [Entomospira entomophilus]
MVKTKIYLYGRTSSDEETQHNQQHYIEQRTILTNYTGKIYFDIGISGDVPLSHRQQLKNIVRSIQRSHYHLYVIRVTTISRFSRSLALLEHLINLTKSRNIQLEILIGDTNLKRGSYDLASSEVRQGVLKAQNSILLQREKKETQRQLAQLCYSTGLVMRNIVFDYRSINYLGAFATRFNKSHYQKNKQVMNRINALRRAGKSTAEIAHVLNLSKRTINRKLHQQKEALILLWQLKHQQVLTWVRRVRIDDFGTTALIQKSPPAKESKTVYYALAYQRLSKKLSKEDLTVVQVGISQLNLIDYEATFLDDMEDYLTG